MIKNDPDPRKFKWRDITYRMNDRDTVYKLCPIIFECYDLDNRDLFYKAVDLWLQNNIGIEFPEFLNKIYGDWI